MRIFNLDAPLYVRAALFCIILFWMVPSGFALSLGEALARLETNSPALAEAREEAALAKSRYTADRAWPNPRLTGSQEFLGADEEPVESAIGIEQELGFLWSQRSKVNAARYAYDAAQARYEEVRSRLEADFIVAALEFDGQRQLRQELVSILTQARQLMESVEARRELGDISRYDSERFAFEIVHLENELLRLDAETQAKLTKLVSVSGLPGSDLSELEFDLSIAENQAASFTLDSLLSFAQANRPLYQSAKSELQALKSQTKAVKAALLPDFGIAVGENYAESGDAGLYWEAGIEIPLFGQGRSAVNASKARLRTAELKQSKIEQEVEQEIRSAFNTYSFARHTITVSTDSLITRAQANIERGRSLYIEGELSVFELVDVLNSGIEIIAAAISQRNAFVSSELELRRAAGMNLLENNNE